MNLMAGKFAVALLSLWAVTGYAADRAVSDEVADTVRQAADAVLRDFPEPPPFDWGEGVLMTGMMRAYRLTGDERYLRLVRGFADHWQEKGIEPLLNAKGYCGHWGPAYPVLMLFETTKDPRHLELAGQVTRFIATKAGKTKDGAWNHFFTPPQLWVDTLFMGCPVLSHGSRLLGDPRLQAEATRQITLYAQRLQDARTGLFYHQWDEQNDQRTTNFWARGNGWVAMSCVDVLKNEPPGSAARRQIEAIFQRQLAGIMACQDQHTGLWHTVMEAPGTYLETSGSAMFLYALAETRKGKLLDLPYEQAARNAWQGLRRQVDKQGRVVGVSAGTRPYSLEKYAAVPQGTFTWGTGAFLMAACAYAESGLAK